uniref:Uncharacterized protein n=1 Tax=Triticum urartu TaxID=4572 RepID=A0A8R7QKH0_TRIUA
MTNQKYLQSVCSPSRYFGCASSLSVDVEV